MKSLRFISIRKKKILEQILKHLLMMKILKSMKKDKKDFC